MKLISKLLIFSMLFTSFSCNNINIPNTQENLSLNEKNNSFKISNVSNCEPLFPSTLYRFLGDSYISGQSTCLQGDLANFKQQTNRINNIENRLNPSGFTTQSTREERLQEKLAVSERSKAISDEHMRYHIEVVNQGSYNMENNLSPLFGQDIKTYYSSNDKPNTLQGYKDKFRELETLFQDYIDEEDTYSLAESSLILAAESKIHMDLVADYLSGNFPYQENCGHEISDGSVDSDLTRIGEFNIQAVILPPDNTILPKLDDINTTCLLARYLLAITQRHEYKIREKSYSLKQDYDTQINSMETLLPTIRTENQRLTSELNNLTQQINNNQSIIEQIASIYNITLPIEQNNFTTQSLKLSNFRIKSGTPCNSSGNPDFDVCSQNYVIAEGFHGEIQSSIGTAAIGASLMAQAQQMMTNANFIIPRIQNNNQTLKNEITELRGQKQATNDPVEKGKIQEKIDNKYGQISQNNQELSRVREAKATAKEQFDRGNRIKTEADENKAKGVQEINKKDSIIEHPNKIFANKTTKQKEILTKTNKIAFSNVKGGSIANDKTVGFGTIETQDGRKVFINTPDGLKDEYKVHSGIKTKPNTVQSNQEKGLPNSYVDKNGKNIFKNSNDAEPKVVEQANQDLKNGNLRFQDGSPVDSDTKIKLKVSTDRETCGECKSGLEKLKSGEVDNPNPNIEIEFDSAGIPFGGVKIPRWNPEGKNPWEDGICE